MIKRVKASCLIILFFIISCHPQENGGTKEGNVPIALTDSIYIRYEVESASAYKGDLSIISPEAGQYIIRPRDDNYMALAYPKGSVLTMLSIPYNSIYPVSAGDSLTVSYPSYYPLISISNPIGFNEVEINFSTYLAQENSSIFEYFFKRMENQTDKSPDQCYEDMLGLIESNQHTGVIGHAYSEWIKREAQFAYYSLTFSIPPENNKIPYENHLNLAQNLDSYHYRQFLTRFARQHLRKEFDLSDLLSIADQYYEGETRDFLIYNLSYQLLEIEPDQQKIDGALNKLSIQFQDSTYHKLLSQRYTQTFEASSIDPNVSDPLFNPLGESTSLNEVFRDLEDNLVYVDFWASWCVPCRTEFPYASILKQNWENIIFLYISIDRQQPSWLHANTDEKLGVTYSYIMSEPEQSAFMEKHKIEQIPRYFLIGRNGEILHDRAPKPSDPLLEELFVKYGGKMVKK